MPVFPQFAAITRKQCRVFEIQKIKLKFHELMLLNKRSTGKT